MDVSIWTWGLTLGFVTLLIIGDLLLHRRPQETSLRESAWATVIWTLIGLAFSLVVLAVGHGKASGEYLAGYLLERSLSVDNVFVFVLILSYFAVPPRLQHRALLFGVLAALFLRAIFIFLGAAVLDQFEWTVYIFGALLLFTAIKLFTSSEDEVDPGKNVALRGLRKLVPVTDEYHEHKLFTRLAATGKRAATPLLAVLLVLGTTDLIFAIDSIPAIFAVTREPYLVFTSNAFALLGLRPMSFLLAQVIDRFAYLKHALAIVLALVGMKMIAGGFHVHVNVWLSLVVIALILAGGIGYSLYETRGQVAAAPDAGGPDNEALDPPLTSNPADLPRSTDQS